MPRYYFDIENGGLRRDDIGTEYATLDEVRAAAMQILPEIMTYEAQVGDRHTVTVIVRDTERCPVFTTTLTLTGFWLIDR